MPASTDRKIFVKHLPEYSVEYCYQLWVTLDFVFNITRKRNSKLGDYRYDPATKQHAISVNNNLNKYSFLITYIHEVAHLTTREKHPSRVLPHGNQWKQEFRRLLLPMLNDKVFPDDVLRILAHHMKNPKASSTSDKNLYLVLRKYDDHSSETLLGELESGTTFLFNQKIYRKLEKRRTRSLCLDVNSDRKYLISETAPVKEFKN